MTPKEKVEAYDKVAKEVREFFEGRRKMPSDVSQTLEHLFPELKESSEDERIKKCIIDTLKNYHHLISTRGITKEQMLAWLEKQGEQKSAEWHSEDEQNLNACLGYIEDVYLRRWLMDAVHVKYDKLVDNAIKVEPKFKVGDFIVNDYCMGRIVEITSDAYLLDTGQGIPFSCEQNIHLWTIQDAKAGDIIVTPNQNIFIFLNIYDATVYDYCGVYFGKFQDESSAVNGTMATELPSDYAPATKEQRAYLFAKMFEEGYKWDSDKKELVKISEK